MNFSIKKITILGQMFDFGLGLLTVSLANVRDLTPDCYAELCGDAANDQL